MFKVIEVIFILFFPLLILWLQRKVSLLKTLGAVALCYLSGFLLALLPISYDKGLSQTVASVIVAVAIPLILMGLNLRKVKTLVREFLLGYGAQIVAVILVSAVACVIAENKGIAYAPQLAGMAVGLYTGGTPNLIAIGNALIPFSDAANVIAAANTADFVVGGVYFLLILTVIRPLYSRILGRKPAAGVKSAAEEEPVWGEHDMRFLRGDMRGIGKLLGCLLLAVAVLAVGVGLELLINGSLDGSLYLMVTVSVLGVALSFVKPIRSVRGSYQLGQYLVLVFSLGLSMSIDFRVLLETALPTLLFFALAQVGVVLLHFLLCKLWKVDGGTALITSTAGIYGPPFISPVALAWGDRELIAPGIICGVLGLAIGNLLGIAAGMLFAWL